MKKFFSWLFLTDAYLATLSDEQIAVRALGKRRAYEWERSSRAFEANMKRLDALFGGQHR
jgi:hypothetical protein